MRHAYIGPRQPLKGEFTFFDILILFSFHTQWANINKLLIRTSSLTAALVQETLPLRGVWGKERGGKEEILEELDHVNKKNLHFSTEVFVKALPPPQTPSCFIQVFFYMHRQIYVYIYVFKTRKPEMDDFQEKNVG